MDGRQASDSPSRDHEWSASQWESFLEGRFDFPIRVLYGRSRSAPVQARALRAPRRSKGRASSGPPIQGWELRLHRRFGSAPEEVRDALATWLRAGRRATKAGPILDAWIHREIASLPVPERKVSLSGAGEEHDLDALAKALFLGEFKDDFEPHGEAKRPRISWGRRTPSRSRRSLRLGSFEPTARIVRVHPALDQPGVPEWFVRFVLKHEILHAVIDTYRDSSGRWVHHGPKFRRREASWPEFEAALHWESNNLGRLIRSAREGTKMRVRPEDLVDPAPVPETDLAESPIGSPIEVPKEIPVEALMEAPVEAQQESRAASKSQLDLPF